MFTLPRLLTAVGVVLLVSSLAFDFSLAVPSNLVQALAAPLLASSASSALLRPVLLQPNPMSSKLTAPSKTTAMPAASASRPKPPSKKQIGNAGWTLIHAIAANYPEKPTEKEQHHARAFLRSFTKLYPCKRCRHHFSKYMAATPPDLSSRQTFMIWACGAHNAVNERQGKQQFPCNLSALEARWGDCGCNAAK